MFMNLFYMQHLSKGGVKGERGYGKEGGGRFIRIVLVRG